MSIADHKRDNHDTWTVILDPVLCNAPDKAESLARLLFSIKEGIDDGIEGVKEAGSTILDVIGLVYLYTDAHKAAFELYLLSLTGDLRPQDEPLQLINEAIKRSTDRIKRASAIKRKRKSRALKKTQH